MPDEFIQEHHQQSQPLQIQPTNQPYGISGSSSNPDNFPISFQNLLKRTLS